MCVGLRDKCKVCRKPLSRDTGPRGLRRRLAARCFDVWEYPRVQTYQMGPTARVSKFMRALSALYALCIVHDVVAHDGLHADLKCP